MDDPTVRDTTAYGRNDNQGYQPYTPPRASASPTYPETHYSPPNNYAPPQYAPQYTPPRRPAPPARELRRQRGLIGGVCGGLGEYFGISPWWFRIVFLILLAPGGLPGFTPYVLLWILIPRKSV